MKFPCCSVCQNEYNDGARCPLLLQCGHEFCQDCMSKIFTASPGHAISCPQCRHVTTAGNSVTALPKNYEILSLIHEDDEDLEEEDEVDDEYHVNNQNDPCKSLNFNDCSTSCGNNINNACTDVSASNESRVNNLSSKIDLAVHREVKLVKKIEEESVGTNSGSPRHSNIEMWNGLALGTCCKHRVAVKKVYVDDRTNEDVNWIQEKLEELRRKSMWCLNVCTFHGVTRMENSLCLVMNRYRRSLQTEIQRNEGRLTLEQILRYGADIARGVAELHAAGVVCMNIKPSSLLLDDNDHVLVSDYGLAQILRKPDCREATEETESSNIHLCIDCTTLSPNYTAPEAWELVNKSLHRFWDDANGISKESDAWSFGCTLVQMCTGSIPWAGLGHEEIYKYAVKSKRQPPQYSGVFGAGVPLELWKMIGECLQFKPSKRPTFPSMLSVFLRLLQEIPQICPSTTPNNDVEVNLVIKMPVPAPFDDSEVVYPTNPRLLRRLVSEEKLDAVREMLARGSGNVSVSALLRAKNEQGETILHLACKRGDIELVEAILESEEADVDAVDNDGDPPLVFAIAAGSPECVRALAEHSAYVGSRLRHGLGPSLVHACAYHNGQPDCMRELLMAGADPNSVEDEGESALHTAVANKFTECAIVILENGGCRSMSILNYSHLTPLHLCVTTWNVAVVKRWLEVASKEDIAKAIDIESPMGIALCMAASAKKHHQSDKIKGRELVRMLLAAGADPSAQDAEHQTVLHIAAGANDAELVKIILEAGVDVNISNAQNKLTPLHRALASGAKPCVDLLLSAGANCNLQDDDGHTAFHVAAAMAEFMRDNMQCLVAMLSYPNAALDVRNHSGKTLRDYLEALPREWIPEDLIEALAEKGLHLSQTFYQAGDWVRYRTSISTPSCGWNGATHETIGFVQEVPDSEHLIVSSSCSGKSKVLKAEVVKAVPMERGHHVQLKPDVIEPRFGLHDQSRDSTGTILCHDVDGFVYVEFPGANRAWKADPAEIQRVEEFKVGDWARVRPKHDLNSVTPGSIGVVSSIGPDYSVWLELSYFEAPWKCDPQDLERVEPFKLGDRVCVKLSVAEPRFGWGDETHHSVGTIKEIENDGRLTLEIPNRPTTPWMADPSEVEKLEDFKIGDWVIIKPSIPSPKYGWDDVRRNSIGIIHCFEEEGDIGLAFCFRSKLFWCSLADVEKVPPFELGQATRVLPSVSQPRLGWSNGLPSSLGKIARIDMDGTLNIKVPGRRGLWRVSPDDAERPPEFQTGDWVRVQSSNGQNKTRKETVAVVRSVPNNGSLELASAFYGGGARWFTHSTEVERVPGFKVGQRVKFHSGLGPSSPAISDARGFVASTNTRGMVAVKLNGSERLCLVDPANLEHEPVFEVAEWVRLKEGASDWRSVGPGCIGVVQGLAFEDDEWDGNILVGFCGEQEPWAGSTLDLERVDRLRIGQRVRVKNSVERPRFGWSGHSYASVGTISSIDADGKLRMYTPPGWNAWALDPSEVEAVEDEKELRAGDWVRVKPSVTNPSHLWGDVSHSSIGVVHRAGDEGDDLWVAFCFMEPLWLCKAWEVERVRPFKVGDKVRTRDGLVTPRWGWCLETRASRGVVVGVDANGKLRIKFRWREGRTWIGDPADIILDES